MKKEILMKKIGFTASSFDMLHAGHCAMLKESKENCDYLIVGLNVNPINKNPVQSLIERFTQLDAVKYVDKIVPYNGEDELIDLLKLYDVNIRFIGDDYRDKSFTGDTIPDIEIFYNSRNHRFSSSGLKKEVVINQTQQSKDEGTYTLIDNTKKI